MFNYTVQVNKIKNPLGKIVAFASLTIETVFEAGGFKIIDGSNGLFVSPPQHKGKGKDEQGNAVDKWFDDIRFVGDSGEDVRTEVYKEIINTYLSSADVTDNTAKASAAQAQENVNANSGKRAPLW